MGYLPALAHILVISLVIGRSSVPNPPANRVFPACNRDDGPPNGRPAGSPDPGTPADEPSETLIHLGPSDAIRWGSGSEYGVVLVHGAIYDAASWRPQARVIAEHGMTVLAVEQITPPAVVAAVDYLHTSRGTGRVAIIGASAGVPAAIAAAAARPDVVDQLVILAGTGNVETLGPLPTLFIASEGDRLSPVMRRFAEQAPGDDNLALILPGDAHAQAIFTTDHGPRLMAVVLERLEKHRSHSASSRVPEPWSEENGTV